MKKTVNLFASLFLLFCGMNEAVYAQCENNAASCEQAIPICSQSFDFTMATRINNSGAIPGCGGGFGLHNTTWHRIIADSSMIGITVTPSNCQTAGGYQTGLYLQCDINGPNIGVQCACTTAPVTFSGPVTPGDTLYLMVDGCSGDVCDINYTVILGKVVECQPSPVGQPDVPVPDTDPACPGLVVTFSVPPVAGASWYDWDFPADVVVLEIECNEATVLWGSSPGNTTVTAGNAGDTIGVTSAPHFMNIYTPETTLTGAYCAPVEPGWYYSGNGGYWSAGIHDIVLQNGASNGCDSIIHLVITANTDVPEFSVTTTDESCDGIGDGAAYLTHNDPAAGPFTVIWSDSTFSTPDSVSGLAPGIYTVTVSVQSGCYAIDTFEIFSAFDLAVTSTTSDCDTTNGTATAIANGGSSNFIFEWSNGQTGNTIGGLAPGGYSITATDQTTTCRTHRNVLVNYDSSCVSYISGYVYNDELLQTCIPPLPGVGNILVALDNGQATITDVNGYFEFEVEPGIYILSAVLGGNVIPGCADPIQVDASIPDTYPGNNFFVKFLPNSDLQLKVVKPNPRPGFDRSLRICLMNVGTNTMNGTLTFIHDDQQEFISSNPSEDNYDATTRTVTWDFTGIPPGAIWIYNPVMRTPASIPVGETIDYYFRADPILGDVTPLNNEWACSLITTNAYDPNDKQVMPIGEGPEGFISREDSLLSYLVRFQNTGSDTAYTVVVRDTLDSQLDLKTLVPGPSSHPYQLDVLNGNVLEFTFNNIYLPDSTVDLEGSQGFVFFDIQFFPDIEEGAEIRNAAAIFFDFNPPVITNEVVNTLRRTVGTYDPEAGVLLSRVFPNPSSSDGILYLELEDAGNYEVKITDIFGREVKKLQPLSFFSKGIHTLPLGMKAASSGLYLISIQNGSKQFSTLKWIKI